MKKIVRVIVSTCIMIATLINVGRPAVFAAEEYINLSLGKPATTSSVYPGKPWTGAMAVDGIVSADSRWGSKRATGTSSTSNEGTSDIGTPEQWLMVDLGTTYTIDRVHIKWEAGFATKYKIQGSLDGNQWTDLKEITNGVGGNVTFDDLGKQSARYIRIYCLTPNVAKNGYSIYELEVYDFSQLQPVPTTAQTMLAETQAQTPVLSQDGKKLILPTLSDDNYKIELYGSDNKQVIDMAGNIITPLQAMDVNLLYKVTNKNNEKDVAYSATDINIMIPGKHETGISDNAKPNVLPGLREWKGGEGDFVLQQDSRIVAAESLTDIATSIQKFFKDMLNFDIAIVTDGPKAGDIYLTKGSTQAELGSEGYYMEVNDHVTITAPTDKGILYGGISATQILYQDPSRITIPKGIARDYPKYEVRSGMIDVGRMFIPLEYLEELTIYMSWFKLNEMQVHVNDYWSASGYSAFRLESDTYPQIVATDGYYTKDEYRQYQIDMKKCGIDVITEIDTPYHAESFRAIDEGIMLPGNPGYLDITKQKSYDVIENLFDEYLDGENPVIQSQNFHIGTDEYSKTYSEQMRKWTDHFINYVNDKGYSSRLWGSLGTKGFNGTTPVSNQATMNLWAPYWADVKEMYAAGYDMINTCGGWLYIVPAGNAGYPDRLDIASLYNAFEVNNYSPSRNAGQGTAIMPIAHPQTKGAEFAVWNDMTSFKTGFSWFDIYDRMKEAVSIVSEKTWYGEKTEGQSSEEFLARVASVQNKVSGANPGRFIESKTSQLVNYDFEKIVNDKAVDLSENKFDGTLVNATYKNGVATFIGDGYLTLPMNSIGYPYTMLMDIKLNSVDENTILFSGKDGTLYANIDGTGKMGYKRGDYRFTFNYALPLDTWINVALVADATNLTLYINGKLIQSGKTMDAMIGGKTQQSSTFVLPTEKIMYQTNGSLDKLSIYNYTMNINEITAQLELALRDNVALNKTATASSQYAAHQGPEKAVDGINNNTEPTLEKQSRWASARTNNEWIQIDLGDTYKVSQINIEWEGAYGVDYKLLGSLDGENWFNLKIITGNNRNGAFVFDNLGDIETRYIKMEGTKAATSGKYGYSIYELEVYESYNNELLRYANNAVTELKKYTAGDKNGNIEKEFYNTAMQLFDECIAKGNGSAIDEETLLTYKSDIQKQLKKIVNHIVLDTSEVTILYELGNTYSEKEFTKDSWVGFTDALQEIKEQLDTITMPKQVDEIKEQLQSLLDTLVILDRSPLKEKLDTWNALHEDEYTTSSWQAMLIIKEDATIVYNAVSLNQIDIAQAVERLDLTVLVDRGDITELRELVDSYDKGDYTEESWALFSDFYQVAQTIILDNSDVSSQKVKDTITLLIEKALLLVERTDINELKELVASFEEYKYTKDSWKAFTLAIADVEDFLTSLETPKIMLFIDLLNIQTTISEADVQEMKMHVQTSADTLLVLRGDITNLKAYYDGLKEKDYTIESWAKIESQLTKVKAIIEDNSNVSQNDVDTALIELINATKDLVKISDNVNNGNNNNDNISNNTNNPNTTIKPDPSSKPNTSIHTGDFNEDGLLFSIVLLISGYIGFTAVRKIKE